MLSHRNHLGIITNTPLNFDCGANMIDLTSDSSLVFGGLNGIGAMGNGKFALFSGDFNGDGQIQNTDKSELLPLIGGPPGMSNADLDMNGQIQNSDIQLKLNPNIGKGFLYSRRTFELKLFAKRRNN
jgi:hypothetical protein